MKHLLYTEKYTIEGARQKVDEHRKGGELKSRRARRAERAKRSLDALERELRSCSGLPRTGQGGTVTARDATEADLRCAF